MHPQTLEVLEDFSSVPDSEKLNLLLEYSDNLPEAPARYGENPELFERVTECQSPVFIAVEGTRQKVNLVFSAPREAPTTRGFASVLFKALDGLSVEEITALPDSFVDGLGLTKLISPLRMRGMAGMLARIKRRSGELI